MARVFRLFISSTFQDWQKEREYLRHHIFPKLGEWVEIKSKELGLSARFLPVDLRWGVSEEAGKTHATVDICLNEIRRCQEQANRPNEVVKPNFLIFLGQRYGWRPVPPTISQDHWMKLEQLGVINELFCECYEEDLNAAPSEWVLKDVDGGWQKNEKALREKLDNSYLTNEEKWKNTFTSEELAFLIGSVTEQEIVRGAFQADNAKEHVHVFLREFKSPSKEYLSDDEKISPRLLDRLKKDLESREFSIHQYQLKTGIDDNYLQNFGNDVQIALQAIIEKELNELHSSGDEGNGVDAPDLSSFVDRVELTELMAWDAQKPILLYGEAGTGKSTLLSKAAEQMDSKYSVFTYWIGRDTRCASGTGLLQAIMRDLHDHSFIEESDDFKINELSSMGYSKLESIVIDALKTLRGTVRIIIDAVDQLPDGDQLRELQWLVPDIPLLLSSLDESQKETFILRSEGADVVYVSELSEKKSRALFIEWLNKTRNGARKLQSNQLDALMKEYNGKPLHLRILYERAFHLRSFDGVPEWLGGDSLPTEDAIADFYNFLSKDEAHGKVMVERTLAYLPITPFGLPETVLLELLRKDDVVVDAFNVRSPNSPDVGKDRLPEVVWSRLYHDLEPFLARRTFFNEEYLSFYHAQFTRLVTSQINPWVAPQIMHECRKNIEQLANHPENKERENLVNEAELSLALRRFLYRHGTANGISLSALAVAGACERLTNFSYLMARLEILPNNEVGSLFDEYRALEEKTSLDGFDDWVMFMRSNAHLLESGDELWSANRILLQLAIEHADDSPITKQAEAWLAVDGNCDWTWLRSARRDKQYRIDPCLFVKKSQFTLMLPGNRLLSYVDGILRLLDVRSWDCLRDVEFENLKSIKLLNNQNVLLIGRKIIRVWDVEAWCCYRELTFQESLKLVIPVLENRLLITFNGVFDEDWNIITTVQNEVQVWDWERGVCEHVLKHAAPVSGIGLLQGGRIISWCSAFSGPNIYEDIGPYTWVLETGVCDKVLKHPSFMDKVRVLSCEYLISFSLASDEGCTCVWNLMNEKCVSNFSSVDHKKVFKLMEEEQLISCCNGVKPSGIILDSNSREIEGVDGCMVYWDGHAIEYWNVYEGMCYWSHIETLKNIQSVRCLQGGYILFQCNDATMQLWELHSGKCLGIFNRMRGILKGAHLLSDSKKLLSWSDDQTLQLWHLDEPKCQAIYEGHTAEIVKAELVSDTHIISWSQDNEVRLWAIDIASLNNKNTDQRHIEIGGSLLLSDSQALSWTKDGQLHIWNLDTGTYDTFKSVDLICNILDMGNGKLLIQGERRIQIFDMETNSMAQQALEFSSYIAGCRLLSGERVVLWFSSTYDEEYNYYGDCLNLQVWDLREGKCLSVFCHTGPVGQVKLLPRERMISVCEGAGPSHGDYSLRLWSLESGQCLRKMTGHNSEINGLELVSDNIIVSWARDWVEDAVRVWNLENGECVHELLSKGDRVGEIRMLPDDKIMTAHVSGEYSLVTKAPNSLRVWDLLTGKQLEVATGVDEIEILKCKYTALNEPGQSEPKWFGSNHKVLQRSSTGEQLIIDGQKVVKVLHVWQGNNRSYH